MKIHFVAIGGSVMHNLAIALKRQGHEVSGSDDEIYDPARQNLSSEGLLPETVGWDAGRIGEDLDAVIVGMHAKADNPELVKARKLGLKVYSFPEFFYEHSKSKQRVAICGSHGKTTITSMVMHVLRGMGRKFDYMVGGSVQGFDCQVRLSDDAPVIILEGDEYLTSPEDRRPKFLVYQPHIALISGIAWDHINVFPTEETYVEQFASLVRSMPKAGMIVYNEEDARLRDIIKAHADKEAHYLHTYGTPSHKIRNGHCELELDGERGQVAVFGKHNMANLAGAYRVCHLLGVQAGEFLHHIKDFSGASKRLEKIYEQGNDTIFKDFAHSPSKVQATVEAVKEMFGKKNIVACLELHTFSSLNKAFLSQYNKTLKALKHKVIFISSHTLEMKNYPPISREELVEAFGDSGIEYATTVEELKAKIRSLRDDKGNVFLMMSSGNFANQDLKELALD